MPQLVSLLAYIPLKLGPSLRSSFIAIAAASGLALEQPSPQPAASGQPSARTEAWIALRADGLPGAGTAADPFDGSTSKKLDAILRRVLDVEGIRVHFGPGTFYTRSVLADDPVFIRKPHTTILGAGMYRTTLALDPAVGPLLPAWAFSVLQTDQHITPDSHLTVQDMTFDTNWPNLVNPRRDISIGNVNLTGSYCSLIRVRGTNAHGDHASGKESFGVAIGAGGPYDIHDALIADSVVESPRGDYVNGITLTGWTSDVYPATNASGIIRGCKAYDLRADGRHMSAYGVAGGTLTDCYAENSTAAVYMEYSRDLTISNCVFRGSTWRGVWAFPANNYGGIRNLRILNSTIEVSNLLDGAACIEVGSGTERNSTASALISGNKLLRKEVKPRHKAYSIVTALGIPALSVIGNRIERKLEHSQLRGASMLDNRSLAGAPLATLRDVRVSKGKTRILQTRPRR